MECDPDAGIVNPERLGLLHHVVYVAARAPDVARATEFNRADTCSPCRPLARARR